VNLDYSFLPQVTVSEASFTLFLFVAGVFMLACAIVSALQGIAQAVAFGWAGCT